MLGSALLALPNLLGPSGRAQVPVAERAMVPVPAPAKAAQAATDMTVPWIVAISLLLSFAAFFLSRRVLLRI